MEKCSLNHEKTVIPEGELEIADGEFAFREDITEVVLPSTLKRIGKSAFQECVNLESISFPEGLEEIGECAFCNCLSLCEPPLSEGVRVGFMAFHHTKKERKNERGLQKSVRS